MSRFTQAYRTKFATMVGRLNGHDTGAEQQSLLLCVEAMNMLLDSQDRMTRMLAKLKLEDADLRDNDLRRAA